MAIATAVPPTSAATKGKEKPKKSAKSKKSKKQLIIMVVPLLLLLGVGGFIGKGMLAGPAAAAPDPKTVAGNVVPLTSMTLNLADGRYLKITLALQLSKFASPAAAGAEAANTTTSFDGAKALDSAISVLGQRTYRQLIAPGGRAAAQKVLSAEVKQRYDGEVLQVYFTEFLMQ